MTYFISLQRVTSGSFQSRKPCSHGQIYSENCSICSDAQLMGFCHKINEKESRRKNDKILKVTDMKLGSIKFISDIDLCSKNGETDIRSDVYIAKLTTINEVFLEFVNLLVLCFFVAERLTGNLVYRQLSLRLKRNVNVRKAIMSIAKGLYYFFPKVEIFPFVSFNSFYCFLLQ